MAARRPGRRPRRKTAADASAPDLRTIEHMLAELEILRDEVAHGRAAVSRLERVHRTLCERVTQIQTELDEVRLAQARLLEEVRRLIAR